MKKSLQIDSGILVTAAFVSVYLFGLNLGRTGEGLTIPKEVVAAEKKPSRLPVFNSWVL